MKVSRKEAEKLLLSEENTRGTFLVRHSEHNPQGYSLSVKDWEETRGYHVKHYKIKPMDNGGYYIATNQTFSTLQALVQAYTSEYLETNDLLGIFVWYVTHVTVQLVIILKTFPFLYVVCIRDNYSRIQYILGTF